MRHGKSAAALLLLLGSLTSGCSSGDSRLESVAHELSDAVNRCLADVRDRRVKFEDAASCRAMGAVARSASVVMEVKPGPYRANEFAAWAPEEGAATAPALVDWAGSASVGDRWSAPCP